SPEPLPRTLLLVVPDRSLARVAARLGRARECQFSARLADHSASTFAVDAVRNPPPLLIDETLARDAQVESFAERAKDVWVRCGWAHPATDHLAVPPGHTLLVRPEGVSAVAGGVEVCEPPAFTVPVKASSTPTRTSGPPGVPVPTRLRPRQPEQPESLWVLDHATRDELWRFCDAADERVVRRLEAAAVKNGAESRIVIRYAGKRGERHIPLTVPGYARHPDVPGLYLPVDRELRPAIRPAALGRLFGVRAGRIVWLAADRDGRPLPHVVEEQAFRPLAGLVEYRRDETALLAPVERTDPFALDSFELAEEPSPTAEEEVAESPETRPPVRPLTDPRSEAAQPGWLRRSLRALAAHLLTPVERPADSAPAETGSGSIEQTPPPRRVDRKLESADSLLHGPDWSARRRALESGLVRDLPRLDRAARAGRWADLAMAYSATGNPQDAALCWMNAVWESPAPPGAWLDQWLADECRAAKLPTGNDGLDRWLSEPGRPGVARAVAAYTVRTGLNSAGGSEFVASLPRILAFLDQHFEDLPLRAAWLARLAAARAVDGDALGLARWRDRVLARVGERGPGLDLDEPSFLRFHGTASADRFQAAREWLVRVRESAVRWVQEQGSGGRLQWAGLDAETDATPAYALFMFAWGLGCLGERTRSREWAARARKLVARATAAGADPQAHAVLGDLFLLRVKDAQEGVTPKPGLPPDLTERIRRLPEIARYSVDRLRECSRILEPVDRVRAYRHQELKPFWGGDRLGERLSILAVQSEPALINAEARALLAICDAEPATSTLPRVLLTLLEVSPRLEPGALPVLLGKLPDALAWTEAWLAAGPWSESERAATLVRYQSRMIEAAFQAAGVADGSIGPAVGTAVRSLLTSGESLRAPLFLASREVFRTLRRLALHAEAEHVALHLDPGGEAAAAPAAVAPALGVAAGWYVAGNEPRAEAHVDRARELLFYRPDTLSAADRTQLAVAYAQALGFAPPQIAHGRLEELFQRLKGLKLDSTTNRYFTLRPLEVVDTVIRSVVTDDFSLGPAVRGWLADDEFLIRGRIHRDLTDVLREQGIV
ncbi:MAG TPA: hypothetical protein VM529_10625, partial [Gemmata sp.]|nr:hypothetical protein [Gemmata sp.]